ncbi:hypothetical protein K7I13_02855 [Brucepastera parasyntrophica]|uniref:hypothetical protein n=1 Tax=Brucepastera parasyntrophica TaxID=2880008 RepID=UPI00210E2BF5|nr:hypothetical protein [Brucepastera parasyntrophica]ULQ60268.1 hypothetical protein K7I13_02855 [Brucepastera parasyntrophica]
MKMLLKKIVEMESFIEHYGELELEDLLAVNGGYSSSSGGGKYSSSSNIGGGSVTVSSSGYSGSSGSGSTNNSTSGTTTTTSEASPSYCALTGGLENYVYPGVASSTYGAGSGYDAATGGLEQETGEGESASDSSGTANDPYPIPDAPRNVEDTVDGTNSEYEVGITYIPMVDKVDFYFLSGEKDGTVEATIYVKVADGDGNESLITQYYASDYGGFVYGGTANPPSDNNIYVPNGYNFLGAYADYTVITPDGSTESGTVAW